jgi:PAS domain S-box-containing protein
MHKDQTHIQITNERQFEALFNYATLGIIVTDNVGRIIDFNKHAESQFGYSKEEVIGKTVEVLVPPQFHSSHINYRKEFYRHPEPRQMGHGRDLYGLRKDDSEFPVEVSLSYYEIDGKTFVIAFVIDITVRKKNEIVVIEQKQELEKITKQITQLNIQLEQKVQDRTKMLRETLAELEKSKEELSEALETEKELGELKSRFVTMASHEFRTPLSTILSSAFLLEKYNVADAQQKREKHIQRIRNAVSGMKSILEDFLSLGKLEEGSITANIEVLTSSDCFIEIEDTIHEMEQGLKSGQKIIFQHSGDNIVYVDKKLLKNMLLNLISNAIKFSAENSLIQVICNVEQEELIISVKDEGIGISEEDKHHLFERFFRAKNASNIQGTGLGLHIVMKYLELMRGTIEIESKLNEGSCFTIHIPASPITVNRDQVQSS